jgi:hypothetical protein
MFHVERYAKIDIPIQHTKAPPGRPFSESLESRSGWRLGWHELSIVEGRLMRFKGDNVYVYVLLLIGLSMIIFGLSLLSNTWY